VDWSNERYVRLYIRDTTTWKILGWDGQCLLMQLLRKVDRCGFLSLDGLEPWEGAALHTGASEEAARRGVEVLLRKGVLEHRGQSLVFPNYLAAQECVKSDALRAKEYRERRLVTDSDVTSREVTIESRHVSPPSRNDRARHAASRGVTPNQPRHAEPATPGGAGGDAPDGAAPSAPPKAPRKREANPAFDAVLAVVRDEYATAYPDPKKQPSNLNGGLVAKLVKWAGGDLGPLRESLRTYLADSFWAREGHPFATWAGDPAKYLRKAAPAMAPERLSSIAADGRTKHTW
jgi:hypothetical protein